MRVHPICTYKKWNYRQYVFVCNHLSYFDGDLEGLEDEIIEENFQTNEQEEDIGRMVVTEEE